MKTTLTYHAKTMDAANRLNTMAPKSISNYSHVEGLLLAEPLIVAMDALIKYADAYRKRFDSPLCEDSFLADPWLESAKGIRSLLNGDGANAMANDITTDSKDNGAVESMFWSALEIAGYTEETANL